jgi:hypothetical protein
MATVPKRMSGFVPATALTVSAGFACAVIKSATSLLKTLKRHHRRVELGGTRSSNALDRPGTRGWFAKTELRRRRPLRNVGMPTLRRPDSQIPQISAAPRRHDWCFA